MRACLASWLVCWCVACGGGTSGARPPPGDGGAGGTLEPGGSGGTGGEVGPGGAGGVGGTGGEGGTAGDGGTGGAGGTLPDTGTIEGTLVVPSGVDPTVPAIALTAPDGATAEFHADADGAFRLADLAPGAYRLESRLPPNWPATAVVQVARGRIARVQLRLGGSVRIAGGRLSTVAAWSPAGDRALLAIGCAPSCTLVAWDEATGRTATVLDGAFGPRAWGASFSPDGRFVAAYQRDDDGQTRATVFDFETGTSASLGAASAFAFDPSARWLVFWGSEGGSEGPVSARNLVDGAELRLCSEALLSVDPAGPVLCRDGDRGLTRWDPADGSIEGIGAYDWPVWFGPAFERLLLEGDPTVWGLGRYSLLYWRSGGGPPVVVADSTLLPIYRSIVSGKAVWQDRGPAGDGRTVARFDLTTGEKQLIDPDADAFSIGPGGQQIYTWGPFVDWDPSSSDEPSTPAPLRSWDETSGTTTTVAAAATFWPPPDPYSLSWEPPPVVSSWPAFGLFVGPGADGTRALHLHRFADGTTTELARAADIEVTDPTGAVAYFHDDDGVRRSLAVIHPDGSPPVEVVRDEALTSLGQRYYLPCYTPGFAPGFERALLTSGCVDGVGELLAWNRTLGLRRLGRGRFLDSGWYSNDPAQGPTPALYLLLDDAADPVGELRTFDPVTFTDRPVASGVRFRSDPYRETLGIWRGKAAFLVDRPGASPPGTGPADAVVLDVDTSETHVVASGVPAETVVLLENLAPVVFGFELPAANGLAERLDVLVWAPESGAVTSLRNVTSWPTRALPVGQAHRWLQVEDPGDDGVRRLLLIDLPALTVTVLAEHVVADSIESDPESRRAAYLVQTDPAAPSGSLYVTSLDAPAPVLLAEGAGPNALLTANAVIYEVVDGPNPGVYAERLPP